MVYLSGGLGFGCLCALCHGIQKSMEAILAYHPALSTLNGLGGKMV